MSELIISVSGLRGIVGQTLTPDVARRFVAAFESTLDAPGSAGDIVVTRDGRASGPMMAEAICDELRQRGRNVYDAGVAATPTTGVLIKSRGFAGGVQISASHNPAEYNGIKLFGPDGRVLPQQLGERVLAVYNGDVPDTTADAGRDVSFDDNFSEHLNSVCATVDVDRIRQRGFTVVLDSNHGAGSQLGSVLLESLGCDVTVLGDQPDGQFEHPPEPTADNLATVCEKIVNAGAVVGFCQDPDADRLALIDETGRYIGEEYTLAICLDHVLRQMKGPVVTNCATSRMSQDIAEKHGCTYVRAAVGEANVVDAMLENNAVFGGEGNGGPIDPRVGYVRDSMVGMALVLDAMATRGMKVSELADELPRYEIFKTKVQLPKDQLASALDAVERHFADTKADHMDGLRLDWPDRWLLFRASNTEPIVRIITEAPTMEDAVKLAKDAENAINA